MGSANPNVISHDSGSQQLAHIPSRDSQSLHHSGSTSVFVFRFVIRFSFPSLFGGAHLCHVSYLLSIPITNRTMSDSNSFIYHSLVVVYLTIYANHYSHYCVGPIIRNNAIMGVIPPRNN
jgi:hypothetical protein